MKKLLILPLLLLLLLVTGCELTEEEKTNDGGISFYVDESTCVEYIKYKYGSYGGNIIPRLNRDGTIMLNEECLNNAK